MFVASPYTCGHLVVLSMIFSLALPAHFVLTGLFIFLDCRVQVVMNSYTVECCHAFLLKKAIVAPDRALCRDPCASKQVIAPFAQSGLTLVTFA